MVAKSDIVPWINHALSASRRHAAAARGALRDVNYGAAINQFQKAAEALGAARAQVEIAFDIANVLSVREERAYDKRLNDAGTNLGRLGDSIWDKIEELRT